MAAVGYDYSPEESKKRPLEDQDTEVKPKRFSPGGNQPLLKLLVPNYIAGSLIGKGGTLMKEMKEKFGGNIRLSHNGDCYPGTDERIIVLTGEVNEIVDLNNHIMEKVQDGTSKLLIDETRKEKVKIVLTNGAAGLLIGRGGLTIKAIQEESKAKISVTNQDKTTVSGERVLTMSGTTDQRMEACRQIIDKISADASNMANTTLKYANGNTIMNVGQESSIMGHSFNNRQQQGNNNFTGKTKLKAKIEIKLEVPEVLVGPILGKQGQIIRDFAQRSGAKLQFSNKNEYAEGTTDRILTITASDMNQAQTAYSLVNERVEQLGNQYNDRTDVGNQYNTRPVEVGEQYISPVDVNDSLHYSISAY